MDGLGVSLYLTTKLNLIKLVKKEGIWNTPLNSDSDYIIESDFNYPDNIREETKNFPLSLKENIVLKMNLVKVWMKWNQKYTLKKINLRMDWKKGYLIHYRMFKFRARNDKEWYLTKFMR